MTAPTPSPPAPPAPIQPSPPAPQPTGYAWGPLVAGSALVLLGAAWLLSLADVFELRAAYVLPSLLALVGIGLVVGSFRRPHPGLIVLGTLLTVATAFAAITPTEALRGGMGERNYRVTNVADLDSRYELGFGDLILDLSELDLNDERRVRVSLGAGNLNVIVPRNLAVTIDAEGGAGEIVLFGEKTDGVALDRSFTSPDYADADARLELELEVGAGAIEVSDE